MYKVFLKKAKIISSTVPFVEYIQVHDTTYTQLLCNMYV